MTHASAEPRPENPDFSPSIVHHRLMDGAEPEMRWRGGDLEPWRETLRSRVVESLGRWPTERVDLNVRSLWTRDHPDGTIEKVVFTSEPGADVPAYVCLPRDAEPPYRFVICLQGHSTGMHLSIGVDREDETTPIEPEGDRDFGLIAMRHGLAALCIEQRAFGEREERTMANHSSHRCHDAVFHALMLGRTLIGERVWDVDRGIDYLAQRGDADMDSVGLMGLSGGGTTTLFGAAVLPGVAWAMPCGYFCTFRDSILAMHHCECNYLPGLYRQAEMADILGLFAPRPVVVVAGVEDPIFPIEATRREFGRLREIYCAAGDEGACRLVEGPGGHRFYADAAWPTMLELLDAPLG